MHSSLSNDPAAVAFPHIASERNKSTVFMRLEKEAHGHSLGLKPICRGR